MPMTEFPRFAMGDSGACSGKRACHLANCGAFPLRPVASQGWQSGRASRRVAYLRLWKAELVGQNSIEPQETEHRLPSLCAKQAFLLFDHTAIQRLKAR